MSTLTIDRCEQLRKIALDMRRHIIRLALHGGNTGVHIGPALSLVEIVACLHLEIMRRDPVTAPLYRDRFILSKGHGALGYYVALFEAGVISREMLDTYERNGGDFPGQPVRNLPASICFSSGTLGLGLAYGAGLALAARRKSLDTHVYVLMGDGELNEGSVWESAMFAAHAKLPNLTAIVDRNGMQSDGRTRDVLATDVESMWRGFGWQTIACDGHDIEDLLKAFQTEPNEGPRVIVANTVKGKGVSFMESNNEWHHNRLTPEQHRAAMAELALAEQAIP